MSFSEIMGTILIGRVYSVNGCEGLISCAHLSLKSGYIQIWLLKGRKVILKTGKYITVVSNLLCLSDHCSLLINSTDTLTDYFDIDNRR